MVDQSLKPVTKVLHILGARLEIRTQSRELGRPRRTCQREVAPTSVRYISLHAHGEYHMTGARVCVCVSRWASLERAHLDRQGVATRGFRGGSFADGAGPRRSQCRGDASGCLRGAACCSLHAAWRKTRLATRQGLMLWRDVRRMRPGGEGACVTTLLEMPFGAQR